MKIKEIADEDEILAQDDYDLASTFKAIAVTIYDAEKEGLVTMDFIKKMKAILDDYTFRQLFMAEFVEVANQWYDESWIVDGNYGAE